MKSSPDPILRADHLALLNPYQIISTGPEEEFDELARLAGQICCTPIASISFVGKEGLWVKSQIGPAITELPRDQSLRLRALHADESFVLENLADDPIYRDCVFVASGSPVAFYAGVPLHAQVMSGGNSQWHSIGCLCVMDTRPRPISTEQLQGLRTLAKQVMTQLELRRSLWEVRQKQAEIEQALKHSEAFYHSLVETIPQNIFRKDLQGRFTFANSRFCETVKRPLSDVLGKTDFDLFPAELAAKYQQDDRTVLEKQTSLKGIEKHLDAHGSTLYVHIIKSPLRNADGELSGVQGIFWDETERYKAEEELAYERDLLRAMLDNIPDSIYFKDRHSRFIAISRALAIRLGIKDPADAIGKTDADYFDLKHAREALADEERIIRTGQPLIAKTERETWLDGRERWVLTTKVPLRNHQGEIRGTFGISKDITELKSAEIELAKARDAALESARIKSEFLANMSHEIRTPLNAVIGMTGLLIDTPLSHEQRDFAETIRTSADALLTIINDILDFSKIEAGKLAIETIDFDLSEVVEGTVELLAESAQAKAIELASWIHEDVPRHLRGDPGRVRQVLTNLLGNAVKFTERGEVVVDVAVVRQSESTVVLKFSVRDTGVGVPLEAQPRLFHAFVQADGSTTRRYGGTGLGLAISRQLVELMHGEIGFESTPGKGSLFWFCLPFEKQARQMPAPGMASTLEGIRVLVIDDNETNRQIVHRQVVSWRMRNGSANSGKDGLRALDEAAAAGDPFQLVILDMQMPEMDGLTLARAIKKDPKLAGTQLIMLTSMGSLPEERKWREVGVAAYMIKPVKEARLFDTIVSVMRGANAAGVRKLTNDEDPSSRRSARILIAEDNVVNQKVALRQLQKLGYAADAVANGLEVLDALKNVPYDLVLMDCQMPELDGYETTRLIRSEENSKHGCGSRLYVIAMTANALAGDREECLTAGMDDYISKPVRMDELDAAIKRGLNAIRQQNESETLLDQEILASVRELRTPGEPDPLVELIDLFLNDTPERISKILDAFKKADAAELERAVHSLKGSASNLGAKCLAEACAEVLALARAGKLPDSTAVARILSEFERLRPALEKEKHPVR